jgi:hypothetical protein
MMIGSSDSQSPVVVCWLVEGGGIMVDHGKVVFVGWMTVLSLATAVLVLMLWLLVGFIVLVSTG